jgi:hypothetical protein
MSYETTNYLPKGVTQRHAAEFAELLEHVHFIPAHIQRL